jgi:VanZ family protein
MLFSKSPQKLFGYLSLLMLFGILVCTLWPFNPLPPNRVGWLPNSQGLRFAGDGLVVSQKPLVASNSLQNQGCTVELWIRPANVHSVSTILNLYQPDDAFQFLVRQYEDALIISHDFRDAHGRTKRSKIDVDSVLTAGQFSLITITSLESTAVYLNGELKQSYPKYRLTQAELTGQIVLGTSAVDSEPWSGELQGLAFYAKELTPAEVRENSISWKSGASAVEGQSLIARYTFTEGGGETIHGQQDGTPNLAIPLHYFVPYQAFLTVPWKEYEPGWDYWADVLRNILGFIPFGYFVCAYLRFKVSLRRAILIATVVSFTLSLGVEMAQSFLPQRVSSLTDVTTNTLGGMLGAVLAGPKGVGNWLGMLTQRLEHW